MDILQKLEEWKNTNPNGSFTVNSTISIKSPTMEITVHGNTLEDAYSQIEQICKEKAQVPNQPFQNNPAPNPAQAPLNTPLNMNSGKLPAEFNGKVPVRVYTAGQALMPGESTVAVGGLTYVVK